MRNRNIQKVSTIFIISLLLYLAIPKSAIACSTKEPDWWFTEIHEVDTGKDYPTGIWVRVIDNTSTHRGSQTQISIENHTTNSALYILVHDDVLNQADVIKQPETGIPEGYTAITRLRTAGSAWYDAETLKQIIPNFVDYNVREPDRPQDIALPPDQQGQILVLFDNHLFTVPFKVAYKLNPDYDPGNGKDGCYSLIVLPFIFLAEYPYLCYGPLIIASGWFLVKFSSQENALKSNI